MSKIPKLYIIDDDPLHHKLIEYLIKKTEIQFTYESFLHASEALTTIVFCKAPSDLPDLILLDLNMPVISGWGFLELLEAMVPCFEKPVDVIILTSSLNAKDRIKALEYSCIKGFFNKPFTQELLNDILSSTFIALGKPAL